MTISTLVVKNSYNGDGSATQFAYQFPIHTTAELKVIERSANGTETVKVLGTHYSVVDNGSSGGTVTFGTAPASGVSVILLRDTNLTQETDYIANDPFPAETHEAALDKLTLQIQEAQEEIDRSIKLSRTNTMTSTEFTNSATDRAGKILAFDTSGELSIAQELGSNRGNWAASTAYAVRDIVKDTSNNNIYMVKTAHTSSGSQPLSSNVDIAKWDLLVDAAAASTSAAAAAASETAAAASETAAANSAATANTHKNTAETHKNDAQTAKTAAETAKTAAEAAQTAAEAALDTFDDKFLGAKASDPTLDNDGNALADGSLYFDTTNNLMKVYDLGNTVWRQLSLTATNQTNVNTVANQISPTNNIATVAGANSNITAVAGQITPTNNIATLAGISGLSALASSEASGHVTNVSNNLAGVNSFAERYRVLASAPGSNNDVGDLYFDTTADELKVYKTGGWAAAGSTVNGTANRFEYTATAGQTTFSGADSNSAVLAYDAGFIDVYLNGVKLAGADYTATSGTSVVLAAGAALNDILMVVAYGTFQLANVSINDLTDTPAAIGSPGHALIVNSGGTALTYAPASSAEVYGFQQYFSPSTINITVTDSGGVFLINGVAQQTLNLYEGNTYVFSYPASHPFALSTTSNGSHGGGSEYTTGVTRDTGANTLTYVVPSSAPQLYYYCTAHTNMGGTANTPVPANNSLRVITTNQGADSISATEYESFSDVLFSASGFVFSLNATTGRLIATI